MGNSPQRSSLSAEHLVKKYITLNVFTLRSWRTRPHWPARTNGLIFFSRFPLLNFHNFHFPLRVAAARCGWSWRSNGNRKWVHYKIWYWCLKVIEPNVERRSWAEWVLSRYSRHTSSISHLIKVSSCPPGPGSSRWPGLYCPLSTVHPGTWQ